MVVVFSVVFLLEQDQKKCEHCNFLIRSQVGGPVWTATFFLQTRPNTVNLYKLATPGQGHCSQINFVDGLVLVSGFFNYTLFVVVIYSV